MRSDVSVMGPDLVRLYREQVTEVGGRIKEAVQQGFPEVGWSGDPALQVVYNHATSTWSVEDTLTSPPSTIVEWPDQGLRDLDFRWLCEALRDARIDKTKNGQIARIIREAEAKREAEAQKGLEEFGAELSERLLADMTRYDE